MEEREEMFPCYRLDEEHDIFRLRMIPFPAESLDHDVRLLYTERIIGMKEALAISRNNPRLESRFQVRRDDILLRNIMKQRQWRHVGAEPCRALAETLIGFNETIDGLSTAYRLVSGFYSKDAARGKGQEKSEDSPTHDIDILNQKCYK